MNALIAYTQRVLQLLYPEEQATSSQNSNRDHDNSRSVSSESLEGAAKGTHDTVAQEDSNNISGNYKVYGADIPPEILEKSQLPSRESESSSDDDTIPGKREIRCL